VLGAVLLLLLTVRRFGGSLTTTLGTFKLRVGRKDEGLQRRLQRL